MVNRQGLMKRLLMILTAAVMACSSAQSGIGDWKNFTAMNTVRAVASAHDSVWAATSGGAFLYTLHDSSFIRFTNSEGLTTNDLTAIVIDRTGSVWFGQSDGSIDIYAPATGRWRYIRDIAVSDKSQKAITSFFAAGDSMYIGTAFGVSLFSISRFEFIDTYGNFGTVVQPPVLAVAVLHNRVYAATSKGIAVSKASAVNRAAPDSWDPVTAFGAVSSLSVFQGSVLAGGAGGLFIFDGSSWLLVPAASQPVALLAQTATVLYFARDKNIFSYAPGGAVAQIGPPLPADVTSGTIAGTTPVFGTDSLGVARLNTASAQWSFSAPNGPASNSFVSVVIDHNGDIWSASGRTNGNGFYRYNGSQWTNYSRSTLPGLTSNNCFGIAVGPDNSKWICTWDSGLVLMNPAGKFVTVFDSRSTALFPGFTGIPENRLYIVPAVPAFESDGTMWTSVFRSSNLARVVWKMNPDSSWVWYPGEGGDYHFSLGVTIDRNGTKWFSNQVPGHQPTGQLLVYLNEKIAVAGTSDGWGQITTAEGATSDGISCVVEDRDGAIWLGTSVGITTITDPLHPLKSIGKVFLGAIRDQFINCIVVDAVNNKWVGTSRGVFVLSPDGTSLLEQYTVANSNGKLVDDNVMSIAFDTQKGIAYFGTEKGLSSVGIATIAPAADFSGITAMPNPFIPGSHPYVIIQGLADASTIKILTVSGKLVHQFPAQGGGRAFWDGKTESGETVASGIYLAVAYSANGSQIGIAKVAVIRR